MSRKRPRSLEAPVTTQARRLEAWAYVRADQWKKKYRYTLIDEYRRSITYAKNEIITALELPNRFRSEKVVHYSHALAALVMAESNMDLMIMDQINVMSEKEWSQAAGMIDEIRNNLGKLINSLANKSVGESERPNLGTDGVNVDNKDL